MPEYKCVFSSDVKHESTPAWTQEAYCPLCSKYALCCPIPGGYPIPGGAPSLARGTHLGVPPSWPGHRGIHSWPAGTPSLELGCRLRKRPGTSHCRTPWKGHGTSGSIMWRRWDTPWKVHGTRDWGTHSLWLGGEGGVFHPGSDCGTHSFHSPGKDLGPETGYPFPWERTWNQRLGYLPPRKDLRPVTRERIWYQKPLMDKLKTLPSRRTTYAGGHYSLQLTLSYSRLWK